MFEHLTSIIQNIWAISYTYLLYGALLEKKTNFKLPATLAVLTGIGFFYTATGIYFEEHYALLSIARSVGLSSRMVLSMSAILVLYHGTWMKKCFSAVFAVTISGISELMSVHLYVWVNRIDMISSLPATEQIKISIGGIVIAYLITFMIIWTRKKRRLAEKSIRLYLMEMILPVTSLSMLFYVYVYLEVSQFRVISLFLFWINFVAYLLFNKLEQYFRENQEYAMQESQHKLRESYYQQMELHQKEIRMIKHDLKNQLIALSAAFQGEPGAADSRQLEELIGRLSRQTVYDFTAHRGINALLGEKYRQAQQQNIVCHWDIKVPADIRFKDTDLAALIGNILDNAIEACQYCSGTPYIQLQIIYHEGSLVLSSENSTDEWARELTTRKKDKKNHGLGIQSIRTVVDQYHGEMQHVFSHYCYQIELTLFEPQNA